MFHHHTRTGKTRQWQVQSTNVILSIMLLLFTTLPSLGLVQPACGRNADAERNLALLQSADDKTRIAGAGTLVSQWRSSLPTVMSELKTFSGPIDRWTPDQQAYFLAISDVLRTSLSSSSEAIASFRNCDDASIIKPLVWAARGSNQSARLNATLILGNTVDNTTICHVLHHLRDPSINPNGRANLLGVTVSVAGYAYKENVAAIEATLEMVKPKTDGDFAQTLKLIGEVATRAKTSPNRATPLPGELSDPCATFNYDSAR